MKVIVEKRRPANFYGGGGMDDIYGGMGADQLDTRENLSAGAGT